MTCLSLWQPWATLWLLSDPDEKVFETRDWYCSYRGPLLVHAAKKRDGEVRAMLEEDYVFETLWERHGLRGRDLAFGAIIGQVNIIGSCRMDKMPQPSPRESLFGNWAPDRFAIERGPNPVIFRQPVAWRGMQKFFDVPLSAIPEAACV
jgi:activating signal cointegrator 1